MNLNYKNVLKSMPIGIMVLDSKGKLIFFNKEAKSILNLDEKKGYEFYLEDVFEGLEKIKIRKFLNIILKNTKDEVYDIFEKITGESKQYIGITVAKDTRYLNNELIVFVKDHTKEYLSQRKHIETENKLRISENKFHSIFNNTMNAVFILDKNGVILDANTSAGQLFKTTKKKFLNKQIYDFLDVNSKKEFSKLWNDFLLYKKQKGEFKMILKNGSKYDIEYSAVENFFSNFNLLVLHDITELKLEQRRQDYYLGVVGHELRTPLATIKAFAQISQRYLEKDENEKLSNSLSRIDKHVNELTKIVNELLDVTRIKAGKIQLYEEVFDFDSLVMEIIQEIKKHCTEFNILKKGKANKLILADKKRIGQIINTLISNAIKYSLNSDKIIVELFSDKNEVKLKVTDFGIGIPENKHKEIFEIFSKVEELKRKSSPGLGLALYISSEVAKSHGGRIWAESFNGKGSVFNLVLPIKMTKSSKDFKKK